MTLNSVWHNYKLQNVINQIKALIKWITTTTLTNFKINSKGVSTLVLELMLKQPLLKVGIFNIDLKLMLKSMSTSVLAKHNVELLLKLCILKYFLHRFWKNQCWKLYTTSIFGKTDVECAYHTNFGQNQCCKDTFYIRFRLTYVVVYKKINNNSNTSASKSCRWSSSLNSN